MEEQEGADRLRGKVENFHHQSCTVGMLENLSCWTHKSIFRVKNRSLKMFFLTIDLSLHLCAKSERVYPIWTLTNYCGPPQSWLDKQYMALE